MSKIRIILLTQDDPFYLYESTNDLLGKIKSSKNYELVFGIISSASPFGKPESFYKKILKTFKIFGFRFFVHYTMSFILRRIILQKRIGNVFKKYKIPFISLKSDINDPKIEQKIKSLSADLILIIAGNQIIKKNILKSTKFGVYNVHSSLLPDYKGLMPTFWVLKNNEKFTGVTLYKLTEGIDNGPIISQKKIKIHKKLSQAKLILKLKLLANELIITDLIKITNQSNYIANTGGSYFKFPKKEDVIIFKANNKKFF